MMSKPSRYENLWARVWQFINLCPIQETMDHKTDKVFVYVRIISLYTYPTFCSTAPVCLVDHPAGRTPLHSQNPHQHLLEFTHIWYTCTSWIMILKKIRYKWIDIFQHFWALKSEYFLYLYLVFNLKIAGTTQALLGLDHI